MVCMDSTLNTSNTLNTPVGGLVFDIQGYAVHDGPGCRTLIFLSGCALSCKWCSNPEGQLLQERILFRRSKCVCKSFRCIKSCAQGAIQKAPTDLKRIIVDRTRCQTCQEKPCLSSCWQEALIKTGRWYKTSELMEILNRDRDYWGAEGGVTFGGGDPFFQHDFLKAMLQECKKAYIHTAIETSAYVNENVLLQMLPLIDWLFIDIKHMDTQKHKEGCGVGNEIILENVKKVASLHKAHKWKGCLMIRTTVIPGFNDSEIHVNALSKFMCKQGLQEVNLLPFHRLGSSKHDQLGSDYTYRDVSSPSDSHMMEIKEIFEKKGIIVT